MGKRLIYKKFKFNIVHVIVVCLCAQVDKRYSCRMYKKKANYINAYKRGNVVHMTEHATQTNAPPLSLNDRVETPSSRSTATIELQ